MIEELETEAVAQLVAERGEVRGKATLGHQGADIEVRARRRKDGGVVLGYGYDGVRLERAVLLLLICPETACEPSQSAKRLWEVRNPPPPTRQRSTRSTVKVVPTFKPVHLQNDVLVGVAGRQCEARPASFKCLTACPVHAHEPHVMRKEGWDLFEDGQYMAGGLINQRNGGGLTPLFPTVSAAKEWMNHQIGEKPSLIT